MEHSKLILMLENEVERLERFHKVLDSVEHKVVLKHWRTVRDFVSGFEAERSKPDLICLDHDLFKWKFDEPEPGDGREVAEFLASQKPACHAIIHSSNAPAAQSMFFTLQEAGWDVERIAPLGQDWIETYWWPTARPWIFG